MRMFPILQNFLRKSILQKKNISKKCKLTHLQYSAMHFSSKSCCKNILSFKKQSSVLSLRKKFLLFKGKIGSNFYLEENLSCIWLIEKLLVVAHWLFQAILSEALNSADSFHLFRLRFVAFAIFH